MQENKLIKCLIKIEKIRYYKDGWGVAIVSPIEKKREKSAPNLRNQFTIVGQMEQRPQEGKQYHITAEEENGKWGVQYRLLCMANEIPLNLEDAGTKKKFLETLFTPLQIQAMYEAIDDPFQSLLDGNTQDLVKVKGCGLHNAIRWLEKFNQTLPKSIIYLELREYDLTSEMISKLLDTYGNAEAVVQKVKNNPYSLCEIEGIGWQKADKIALMGGVSPHSAVRIAAFLSYYLDSRGQEGLSWVGTDELMGAILTALGEEIADSAITEAIHSIEKKLWWNKEKTKIGLRKYRKLEENIAKELRRLFGAKAKNSYSGWKSAIEEKEKQQGWKYTAEQWKAIELALNSNVLIIHGLAGTGKSTVVDAISGILKGVTIHCALSGRAAARLSEITKEAGYTIHRLLGYPDFSENAKNRFAFHDENQLNVDCVIVDEISMIDGYLFYYLLRAIKTGTKLLFLGDIGQLESIGCCNIASDLIQSKKLPVVLLTEIHRQAEASAIITEGTKVRKGIQLIENGSYAGVETRGELQDLVLDCYSDKSNTYFKVMQYFSLALQKVPNILELQVLSPVKNNGAASTWNLNNAIQELYNSESKNKPQVLVSYGKGKNGVLRVGDKVINRRNKYNTCNTEEELTPIFNGNIGIIQSIDMEKERMVVDFQDIGKVIINKENFHNIHLGYAISVHSAQGSEFKRVIFAVDYTSYALLSRELIYTAFTRAKEHLTVVAQNSALWYAVQKNNVNKKQTHLMETMQKAFALKF